MKTRGQSDHSKRALTFTFTITFPLTTIHLLFLLSSSSTVAVAVAAADSSDIALGAVIPLFWALVPKRTSQQHQ